MNELKIPFLPSETLIIANASCELEVTLTCSTANSLRIHYRVRNTSALPLYLFNQMHKVPYIDPETNKAVYKIDSNLANVQLATDNVKVSKAVVAVPEWVFVEKLYGPCLSRVLPNEAFEEVFELALPLMPYTLYEPDITTGVAVAQPLLFELGYIIGTSYTETFVETVATPTGTAFYIDSVSVDEQSLISIGPFKNLIPVVDARLVPK